jgi:hypothetical protein
MCNTENLIDFNTFKLPYVCSNCHKENTIQNIYIDIYTKDNNKIISHVDYKIFEYILIIKLINAVAEFDFSAGSFLKKDAPYIRLKLANKNLAKALYLLLNETNEKMNNKYEINYNNKDIIHIKNNKKFQSILDFNEECITFFRTITHNIVLFQ